MPVRSVRRLHTQWTPIAAFRPSDITGLVGWYDASNAGSITSSAGLVSQWNDLSGGARHLAQGTGANQPITGTRTQNSLNVLDWDGGRAMNCTLATAPTSRFTICVATLDVTTAERSILGNTSGGGDSYEWRIKSDSGVGQEVLEAGTAHHFLTGSAATTASTKIWAFQYTGTAQNGYINNAADGSLSASYTFTSGGNSQVSVVASSSAWDGAIAELIVYDSVTVSSGDRSSLFGYLNAKWAVY